MKKLLALLLLLPTLAFGVALSPGQSLSVECVNVGTVVVVPPAVPPVVVPPGNYVASGMWIQAQSRVATGTMSAGQEKVYPFTTPSGYPATGYIEVGISGLNLKVFVDGVETAGDAQVIKPGPHTLTVRATGSAEGSIGLYHTP